MLSTLQQRFVSLIGVGLLALGLASCQQGPKAQNVDGNGQTADGQTANGQTPEKPGLVDRLFHPAKPITIPEGTRLTVSLDQALSSAQNKPGDTFEATVLTPVMINGVMVIPEGAHAGGRVVDVRRSGRLHKVARLELDLAWVEVDGKQYEIETGEKTEIGRNHNKRNLVLIGGGSGLGALIGGLAGGGRGALIGGAAGAGAGTVGAFVTGKHDIHIAAETHLTFRLSRSVSIPVKT